MLSSSLLSSYQQQNNVFRHVDTYWTAERFPALIYYQLSHNSPARTHKYLFLPLIPEW